MHPPRPVPHDPADPQGDDRPLLRSPLRPLRHGPRRIGGTGSHRHRLPRLRTGDRRPRRVATGRVGRGLGPARQRLRASPGRRRAGDVRRRRDWPDPLPCTRALVDRTGGVRRASGTMDRPPLSLDGTPLRCPHPRTCRRARRLSEGRNPGFDGDR